MSLQLADGTGVERIESANTSLMSGATSWSIMVWVYLNTQTNNNAFGLNKFGTANPGPALIVNASRLVQIKYVDNSGPTTHTHTSAKVLTTGAWHCIIATYNGTDVTLYIDDDGSPETFNNASITLNSPGADELSIRTGAAGEDFYCQDFALWVNNVLDASDVAALTARTSTPATVTPTGSLWIPLDNTTPGSVVITDTELDDSIGSVNFDAALTLTPAWVAEAASAPVSNLRPDVTTSFVGRSGKVICVRFKDSNGDPRALNTTLVPSTGAHTCQIKVNGGSAVDLERQMCYRNILLLRVQDETTIAAGDTITLKVAAAAVNDGSVDNEELDFTEITNNTDVELYPLPSTRTMELGVVRWYNWAGDTRRDFKNALAYGYNAISGMKSYAVGTEPGMFLPVGDATSVVDHDSNGYPKSITGGTATKAQVNLYTSVDGHFLAGTYRVRWKGADSGATCELAAGGGITVTETGTSVGSPGTDGDWTYRDFIVGNPDNNTLYLYVTPPTSALNVFTEIQVLLPGQTQDGDTAGDGFLGGFISRWNPFNIFRHLLATGVNWDDNNVSAWGDRTPETYFNDNCWRKILIDAASAWSVASSTNPSSYFDTGGGSETFRRGGTVWEITTSGSHGLVTGQVIYFKSDNKYRLVYVTGATTFKVALDSSPSTAQDLELRQRPSMKYQSMVDMANACGNAVWINIPYLADDTFVDSLADLILDEDTGLASGQKCYVEFSNECWNSGFPTVFHGDGVEGAGTYSDWPTERASEVHERFRDKFATAGRSADLVTVLGGQFAAETVDTLLSNYQAWASGNGDSQEWPDLMALAPYCGNKLEDDLDEATDNGEDVRDFFAWDAGAVSILDEDAVCDLLYIDCLTYSEYYWTAHKADVDAFNTAQSASVGLAAYEGFGHAMGESVPGSASLGAALNGKSSGFDAGTYATEDGEAISVAMHRANRHPHIRDALYKMLDQAQDFGVDPFCLFVDMDFVESGEEETGPDMGLMEFEDQAIGPGDGSDGGYDNTTDLSLSNIDNLEAVKMWAALQWLASGSDTGLGTSEEEDEDTIMAGGSLATNPYVVKDFSVVTVSSTATDLATLLASASSGYKDKTTRIEVHVPTGGSTVFWAVAEEVPSVAKTAMSPIAAGSVRSLNFSPNNLPSGQEIYLGVASGTESVAIVQLGSG